MVNREVKSTRRVGCHESHCAGRADRQLEGEMLEVKVEHGHLCLNGCYLGTFNPVMLIRV